MEPKQVVDALNTYIRPQTFPLALGLSQEAPPRARRPLSFLGFPIPECQAWGMARRYGWTMALGMEDVSCPYGALALGFVPPKEGFLHGDYPGAAPNREAAINLAQAKKRLEYGQYRYLIIAPLERADFEPQLVLIYGNSAQVMRLVQGRLYSSGGDLTSSASGGMDCSDIIPGTLLSDECQVVLPCNGDRVFGLAQDDEMAFTLPWSKVEMTIKGLEGGHKSGLQRYPIPFYFRFNPQLPPSYNELMAYLKEGK